MAVTLDPATKGSYFSLSGGDLTCTISSSHSGNVIATETGTGKYYFEVTFPWLNSDAHIGITMPNRLSGLGLARSRDAGKKGSFVGAKYFTSWWDSASTAPWVNWGNDDVVGMAVDTSANRCWLWCNGQWWNDTTNAYVTDFPGGTTHSVAVYEDSYGIYAGIGKASTSGSNNQQATINFGATAFTADLPTGFVAYQDAKPPSRFQSVYHSKNKVINPFPFLGGV